MSHVGQQRLEKRSKNPPSRNVRPFLAEPSPEKRQPANVPGPPVEVDELEQDLE